MQTESPVSATEYCRYCLMCRHVCPVGHVTRRETLTPHGWGLTVASVRRGQLAWNPASVQVLYACADCGNCRTHCVNHLPLPEAIVMAREEVVQKELAPAVVYELDRALQQWGNPYVQRVPQPAQKRGDVALFVGDEAQYVWPAALEASLKLLKAAGVEPVLVGVGRNNGYLASSLGLRQTAERLARDNLEELRACGARRLLFLTPGDAFAFGTLYAERLRIEWPREVEWLEVTGFLAHHHAAGRLSFRPIQDETPTAYIDPPHAVRVPGRHGAPRQLLAAVLPRASVELFWRKERTHPCGNGALQFTQPQLADELARARLEDALQAGAQRVVTEDPGCLNQLSRHAPDYGLQVQGLYELLAGQVVGPEL